MYRHTATQEGAHGMLARVCSVLLCALLAISLVPATALAVTSVASPDVSWYTDDPEADTFEISSIEDLAGLALLVNGEAVDEAGSPISAVTFAGKTVKLTQNINALAATVDPIGGVGEASFDGTFDGGGYSIDNLTIDGSSLQNVGLFGRTGEDSLIKNVSLGTRVSLTIDVEDENGGYIDTVGLLVGYCGGSISGCSVAGTVSVSSAVVQASEDETVVIARVGGIAGVVVKDVESCTFSGTVSVAATSVPVTEYDDPTLVVEVGGIVAHEGDPDEAGETSTPDSHGAISNCVNRGDITVDTPADAGTDRFGQSVTAESEFVGGIAGYSRGDVTDCENYGYIRAENADAIGGIVGSMRSVMGEGNTNYSSEGGDEGSADDPVVLARCVNYGDVYGRVSAGGIAGQLGTYATITQCINASDTYVVATRWNKPSPGGIVGHSYGTVSFCANLGTVASATWDDEELRTLKNNQGYYVGGIAGMTLGYTTTDENGDTVAASPTAEVYACYNAGTIAVQAGFRSRNIVGNNEGFTHDNVALEGMCDQDACVYGELASETDASGQASNNVVCAAIPDNDQTAENSLKGNGVMTYKYRTTSESGEDAWAYGTKDSVFEFLNALAGSEDWETYWVYSSDGETNSGYPVLAWQAEEADFATTDLSGATLELVENAKYSGGEAVPTITATLNGTTLIQNVDFKVVTQEGAINVTDGTTPYYARIEGIGLYTGTSMATVAYGIDKGDLSICTATTPTKTFNWKAQEPDAIEVRDAAGNVVPSDQYSFSLSEEAIDAGNYTVTVTANADSKLFEGETTCTFRIEPAKILRDFQLSDNDGVIEENETYISYLGEDYEWHWQENDLTTDDDALITFAYTGHSIEPTVAGVTYLDVPLVEGRDYRVVYGDLGADEADTTNIDVSTDNTGAAGTTMYGVITVRYVAGGNFTNYDNMYFKITDTGDLIDITQAEATVEGGSVLYEGQPAEPVVVTYGGAELTENVDYTIEYTNNDAPGTASYVVTGIGLFTGTITGTFEIVEGELFSFDFEIVEIDGQTGASITGFSYNGSFDTFDLVIPAEVAGEDGTTYPVIAIGAGAFGGERYSDFSDTDKLRIDGVTIPASVVEIGAYAFGAGVTTVSPTVSSVTFEEGSQLTTIGEGAFRRCQNLTEFTFPAQVATIGDDAFNTCSNLTKLVFLTTSSTLPSSVGSTAFSGVGGSSTMVNVIGMSEDVAAVIKLAEDNATRSVTGTGGANGGKYFVFSVYADIGDASIDFGASSFTYTGEPIEPSVTITYDGTELQEGVDYEIAFSNNVNAGTATATVTGIGSYTGETSFTFEIEAASLEEATVSIATTAYAGSEPDDTISVVFGETVLSEGVDYVVTRVGSYELPGDVLEVTITGTGNYKGEIDAEFVLVSTYAGTFTDMSGDSADYDWFVSEGWIDYVVTAGLMGGYTDEDGNPTGEFGTEDNITRGQVATIVYRWANPDSEATTDPDQYATSSGVFSDLPNEPWYYTAAIQWCYEEGIITGYETDDGPTGLFGPEDFITREQLATIASRLASWAGADTSVSDTSGFDAAPDRSEVSSFAETHMAWCYEEGILTGDSVTGELSPGGDATRAHAAKIFTVLMRDVLGEIDRG